MHRASDSRRFTDIRFVRFLFAGGFAAMCNFSSRFLYSLIVDFGVAVVLAYITGIIVAYLLNKRFVFAASGHSVQREVSWFLLVNLLAIAQTWALSLYLAGVLLPYMPVAANNGVQLAQALAHAAGIVLPVFTSYLGHKYLTFRE